MPPTCASKISESALEGVNLIGDKAFAEAEPEAAAEPVSVEASADAQDGDDVDLEAALGGGIRKAPGVVAAIEEEPETAETAL